MLQFYQGFFNALTQCFSDVSDQTHVEGRLKYRWLSLIREWGLRICFLLGWQVILLVQGLLFENITLTQRNSASENFWWCDWLENEYPNSQNP